MKTTHQTKCTFERVIFFSKMPYWIFWPFIGVLIFALSEVLFRVFNETYYIVSRVIACFAFAVLPTISIWLFRSFKKVVFDLSQGVLADKDSTENWLKERELRIFTLRHPMAKFVTVLIVVAGLVTVIALGLAFKSQLVNVLSIVFFTILLSYCGQTLYISFDLFSTLRDLVTRPIEAPFYLIPNPAILNLQSYYSTASLMAFFLYVIMFVGIWQGPYGLSISMLVWISLLAIYPITMFVLSFIQIRSFSKKIKYSYIQLINGEIQKIFNHLLKNKSSNDVERLAKYMELQNSVAKIKDLPIRIGDVLTFLLALLAIINQILVFTFEIIKP